MDWKVGIVKGGEKIEYEVEEEEDVDQRVEDVQVGGLALGEGDKDWAEGTGNDNQTRRKGEWEKIT